MARRFDSWGARQRKLAVRERVFDYQPKSPALGHWADPKPQSLGYVEAPDQKAAEVEAARAFTLSEWQRKRLLIRERV